MKSVPSPPGRPSILASEALSDRIMATATKLFLEQGYTATSMEQVANAACVGKHTLYRRFSSKEELFAAVYNEEIDRLIKPFEAVIRDPSTRPIEALRLLCRRTMVGLLDPAVVSLCRIAYAESARFPNMGKLVLERSVNQFVRPLSFYIMGAQRDGDLIEGDPDLLSQQILTGCFAYPFTCALLGDESFRDVARREDYFDRAWPLMTGRLDPDNRKRRPKTKTS